MITYFKTSRLKIIGESPVGYHFVGEEGVKYINNPIKKTTNPTIPRKTANGRPHDSYTKDNGKDDN